MLKHIVSIKVNFKYSKEQKKTAIVEIVEALKKLPEKIPQIKYYEVGVNVKNNRVVHRFFFVFLNIFLLVCL